MQVYSEASRSMDVFSFDINSQAVTPLLITSSDELITNSYLNNQFTIVQVIGKGNVKLLFNTYYSLIKYPDVNQFSGTNDFMGRIAWALAYRLEALAL